MTGLSPLRVARDQAIIAACLAEAMERAGLPDFMVEQPGPSREEAARRAARLRAQARRQRDLARAMRKRPTLS